MAQKAEVKLRGGGGRVSVDITSAQKPEVSAELLEKWQEVVNICARIMKIPAALVMRVLPEQIEVFSTSRGPLNPYKRGDKERLGGGLYCETVIATRETLVVPNALDDPLWAENPDVALGLISYLGMPLLWPDREVFGTICVLDSQTNGYSEDYLDLLKVFRFTIERDLSLLMHHQELFTLATVDTLTGIYNRRFLEQRLYAEFHRARRYQGGFSLILFDVDHFKGVNDHHGHLAGDRVLRGIAELTQAQIRASDLLGRWGGEEFLLVCPETSRARAIDLAERIRVTIAAHAFDPVGEVTCAFGVSSYQASDEDIDDALKRADDNLYASKARGRNRVTPAP